MSIFKKKYVKNSLVVSIMMLSALFNTVPVQAFSDFYSENNIQFYTPCDPLTGSCCDSLSTPPADTTAPSSTPGASDAQTAYDYFIGPGGLSPQGAAGIVGNLMRETGGDGFDFNPKSAPPASSYYGIAQWSTTRWGGLVTWAAGKDVTSLNTQLEYIIVEMKKDYPSVVPKVQNATDPQQAARDFDSIFEGGADADKRASDAQQAYDKFKNDTPSAAAPVDSSANPTPVCCAGSGSLGVFSGTVSVRVGYGASAEGQASLQKAVTAAGSASGVDPNFIASFYYAENARTGDSTNNADSASGTPVTGDGKWRDPAPPAGQGGPWDPPNAYTAYGPFQFITSTWDAYKPAGANDTTDRLDLDKEALAAGKYLAASGAKSTTNENSLRQAALAYNHSDTYAQSVLNTYKYLSTGGGVTVSGDGSSSGCADSSDASGAIPTGDSQSLAKQLLAFKAATPQKYNCDNAGDCTDLQNVADGKPIGGSCGVDTFDPEILKLLIYIINNGYTIGTFALCGDHSDDGPNGHHGGKAADISSVNGEAIDQASSRTDALKLATFINGITGELEPRQMITDGVGNVHDNTFTELSFNVINGQKLREPSSGYGSVLAEHRNHIHVGF